MKKRVVIFLCLATLLLFAVPIQVHAATEPQPNNGGVMLRWRNIVAIDVHLSINNGRAVMSGMVIANPGTESISVNAELVRVNTNGTTTHIWSQNGLRTNGDTWVWERPHHVIRGHDYRLTLTVTAVRNGVSETASLSRTTRAN